MGFSVRVRGADATLDVGPDDTILEAALDAGINYPYGCTSGYCGECKSRLHAGEVEMLSHAVFALTADERKSGLILACQAIPLSDCEVAWLADAP
jgi:ferredoxin